MSEEIERIVLVGLKPADQESLRGALHSEAREIICVDSIPHALELAIRLAPDLLVIDLDSTPALGFGACDELQQTPSTERVKVILLRINPTPEEIVMGLDAGAVDVIEKPYHLRVARARIDSAMRMRHREVALEERSLTDSLTGVYNRMYFDRRLDAELNAVARSGRALSLVLVDIDEFKLVNDRFGHSFGDAVLQGTGDALLQTLRRVDVAARYGGEEFGILLTDTSLAGAIRCAERLQFAISDREYRLGNNSVHVTASFGIASTENSKELPEPRPFVDQADVALYAAKDGGRDTIRVADADGSIIEAFGLS